MKKTLLTILWTCIGLIFSHITAMAVETTTIKVGTPNPPTNSSAIAFESVSTTQIDNALTALGGGLYPPNFTAIEANKAFIELADLKQDLETEIYNSVLASPDIKQVYYVNVVVNPIKARLSQQGTSIGLTLSQIDITVRVEAETQGGIIGGLFCPSPDASVDIDGLEGAASYDIYTGNISGVSATYSDINIYNVSCGGILGWFGNLFVGLFTGGIENDIAASINDIEGIANKQTLFSVRNLMEGLLDSNKYTQPYSGKVLTAMDEIIMQTDLNSGLLLDIEIYDGVSNTVSFVASQKAPHLYDIEYLGDKNLLSLIQSANTSSVHIYKQGPYSSTWYYVKSTTGSGALIPSYDVGTKIIAVSESDLISGLISFPSNILTINQNFNSCPLCQID